MDNKNYDMKVFFRFSDMQDITYLESKIPRFSNYYAEEIDYKVIDRKTYTILERFYSNMTTDECNELQKDILKYKWFIGSLIRNKKL